MKGHHRTAPFFFLLIGFAASFFTGVLIGSRLSHGASCGPARPALSMPVSKVTPPSIPPQSRVPLSLNDNALDSAAAVVSAVQPDPQPIAPLVPKFARCPACVCPVCTSVRPLSAASDVKAAECDKLKVASW